MNKAITFSTLVLCTSVKLDSWWDNLITANISLQHDTTTIDAGVVIARDEPLPVKGQMYRICVELLPVDSFTERPE